MATDLPCNVPIKADISLSEYSWCCLLVPTTLSLITTLVISCSSSVAAAPTARQRPAWMLGEWGAVSPSRLHDSAACPEPSFYGGNGYVVYPGGGVDRWWIVDNVLVRTPIQPEPGTPLPEDSGSVRVRITRLGNGDLLLIGPNWRSKLFRCGSTPAEWTYKSRR